MFENRTAEKKMLGTRRHAYTPCTNRTWNGTNTYNNKQLSRQNRISPSPATLTLANVGMPPCVAFHASSSCCALRIYISCLDWCARELYRNLYLMNHHLVPPPTERVARNNYCVSAVAGRQHSKSLHHHERIWDAWATSPLDGWITHRFVWCVVRRCSTRVLNLWFALQFDRIPS